VPHPEELRPLSVEAAMKRGRMGLVLLTIGWVLILFDLLALLFVFAGLRSGSKFYLVWTIIQGALGLVFILIGNRKRRSAA